MAHIYYKLSFLCLTLLLSIRLAVAQSDPSATRVQQLPISFGENSIAHLEHGESWESFGVREHVGYEQLNRANPEGFLNKPSFLLPGRHIAEGYERDGLVLNLPELMLYRWEGGRVVAWYPISIGMMTERWNTPMGRLTVVSRQVNPVWYRPEWAGGGATPPGGKNPLGSRWIGLSRPGLWHPWHKRSRYDRSYGLARLYPHVPTACRGTVRSCLDRHAGGLCLSND